MPKWPHPLAGTTLPRCGRLARASAPLLMQIQDRIFIDGSRGPLSGVGDRPVHVINAALRIRGRHSGHQPLFKTGAATVSRMVPTSPRNFQRKLDRPVVECRRHQRASIIIERVGRTVLPDLESIHKRSLREVAQLRQLRRRHGSLGWLQLRAPGDPASIRLTQYARGGASSTLHQALA